MASVEGREVSKEAVCGLHILLLCTESDSQSGCGFPSDCVQGGPEVLVVYVLGVAAVGQ